MRNHSRPVHCPVHCELSPGLDLWILRSSLEDVLWLRVNICPHLPSLPRQRVCLFSLSVASPTTSIQRSPPGTETKVWSMGFPLFLMLLIPKAPDLLLAVGHVRLASKCKQGQRWWLRTIISCSPLCSRHSTRAPQGMQKCLFTSQRPLQEKRQRLGVGQGARGAGCPGSGGCGASPGEQGRVVGLCFVL